MLAAWERGERPRAEEFLAHRPELWAQPELVADLIYEEICLRREHGESVSRSSVLARFPQWRTELGVLMDCQQVFDQAARPRFPAAGDVHGEFRLLKELGRGSAGVVFLATQPALADRPVVLKLTAAAGSEHLRLARLQHTHIVPLHAVYDDPERRLRTLCMPYFGGASLGASWRRWRSARRRNVPARAAARPARPGTGRGAGRDGGTGLDASAAGEHGYAQAVCWIGSCLAGALHYAHERGLVHLDLKPSNVLLTADGQPMLLDFHLARAPVPAGAAATDGFGGTPHYMSPEQRQALTALCAGRPIPAAVEARSDIYSLGALLYRAWEVPFRWARGRSGSCGATIRPSAPGWRPFYALPRDESARSLCGRRRRGGGLAAASEAPAAPRRPQPQPDRAACASGANAGRWRCR